MFLKTTVYISMRYDYNPTSDYEKFGLRVYNTLVANSEQTFFVGGMVRDLLLGGVVSDVDITTGLLPEQVLELLATQRITASDKHKLFGAIIATQKNCIVEITTLRLDTYDGSRYPKVIFTQDPKEDSRRRDFTINALYADMDGVVYDYFKGVEDLKAGVVRFVGDAHQRIQEEGFFVEDDKMAE